jgi:hypothetical protein
MARLRSGRVSRPFAPFRFRDLSAEIRHLILKLVCPRPLNVKETKPTKLARTDTRLGLLLVDKATFQDFAPVFYSDTMFNIRSIDDINKLPMMAESVACDYSEMVQEVRTLSTGAKEILGMADDLSNELHQLLTHGRFPGIKALKVRLYYNHFFKNKDPEKVEKEGFWSLVDESVKEFVNQTEAQILGATKEFKFTYSVGKGVAKRTETDGIRTVPWDKRDETFDMIIVRGVEMMIEKAK